MSIAILSSGLYARVSSETQARERTIESQLEDLVARALADGVPVPPELVFIDDGYTGSTLVRPALERLRDVAAAGAIDRLYVHCPDRLAREFAHQLLLIDEFYRAGVEIVFLNHEVDDSPEGQLLLQVQGVIAQYERAKILERSRRGRQHAARSGSISVLSGAPYGYRYITKSEGDGRADYRIILEEARVVRQIFEWVGRERCSLREVVRRLRKGGYSDSHWQANLGARHTERNAWEPRVQGNGRHGQNPARRAPASAAAPSVGNPNSPDATPARATRRRKNKRRSQSRQL